MRSIKIILVSILVFISTLSVAQSSFVKRLQKSTKQIGEKLDTKGFLGKSKASFGKLIQDAQAKLEQIKKEISELEIIKKNRPKEAKKVEKEIKEKQEQLKKTQQEVDTIKMEEKKAAAQPSPVAPKPKPKQPKIKGE